MVGVSWNYHPNCYYYCSLQRFPAAVVAVRNVLPFPPESSSSRKPSFPEEGNTKKKKKKRSGRQPHIYISTDPRHVDLNDLTKLLTSSNLSGHRFPETFADGSLRRPVDVRKLAVAIANSYILVSVFAGVKEEDAVGREGWSGFKGWSVGTVSPVTPANGLLVGFGRATSDEGLTAAIYDVAVMPEFRGWGIGKKILQTIIRFLSSRGIYDVSALCCKEESSFFQASGFGSDPLGATTMMYTRTAASDVVPSEIELTQAGRRWLLVPPPLKHLEF